MLSKHPVNISAAENNLLSKTRTESNGMYCKILKKYLWAQFLPNSTIQWNKEIYICNVCNKYAFDKYSSKVTGTCEVCAS